MNIINVVHLVLAVAGDNTMQFVVIYGKVVDDKVDGIHISNVFFGGVAKTKAEADDIAKKCTYHVSRGTILPKIFEINGRSLLKVFKIAREVFNKKEIEMMESEIMLESNQRRRRRKKK